jgi:uncharacterized protein (TIGR00299 family) protein
MRIAYFDCFAGASGDMILGALLDAGLPLQTLKAELAKLRLSHYDVDVRSVHKSGLGACHALVLVDQDHHGHEHRHLGHITAIIEQSDLGQPVKADSIAVFRRLADAEAKVHRTTVENIHFHEVGAMDAVIDVVGAVAGLRALGIEKIVCSPLHLGSGTVQCAHGTLPVPAPATAELVKGKPVYSTGVQGELLTPTGAAILTTLAEDFGPMPAMTVDAVGYGAGSAERAIPNLLRVVVGTVEVELKDVETEEVAVVETNIDDMNPQIYDHIIQQALGLGALDVYLTPVHMKKNRCGTVLTLVCPPAMAGRFARFLLQETTTIGLRWRIDKRLKAHRRIATIETPYGNLPVKVAEIEGEIVNVAPEYEDCRRIAVEKGLPLKQVMDTVRAPGRSCILGNSRRL